MSISFKKNVTSVVSTDPFAVISVVGRRDTLTVSNSSGDKPILLIIRIDAPESTNNKLFLSVWTVEVDV